MATVKTKISIKNFFIFNATFGPNEGDEEKKILFYHPHELEINSKVKDVGLTEAIIKFTGSFTSTPADVENLRTQKTLQLFYQPEPEYWMVLTINVPFERKLKDNGEILEYYGEDAHEKVYSEILKQSYRMFRLFHDSFESNLVGDSEEGKIVNLVSTLEQFYTKHLTLLNLGNGDIVDSLHSIQYLPINHINFLRILNFINMLESHFTNIKYCIFLYNEHLVYSEINPDDLFSINEYLLVSLFPCSMQKEVHRASAGSGGSARNYDLDTTYHGYFLTGSSSMETILAPKMFIYNEEEKKYESFSLVVYRALSATLCMLVQDFNENNDEFFAEVKTYLGPHLSQIASEIVDSTNQVLQNVAHITGQKVTSDPFTQEKYLYFNDLNLRFHATLYSNNYNNNRQLKACTIPMDVMNLLTDLYTRDSKVKRTQFMIEPDKETILKTFNDYWVVKRTCNSRHLYLILNKNSTLIEISEESKKLMDGIINNIYFNKQ